MTLWRGDMNQATLRVDPETRLPVYLLLMSPKNSKESIKWQFDYPADGPTDIYALGVPHETKIDDRMPLNDALAVLPGIAKSREGIGDFRLLVGEYPDYGYFGSVVWRKGDRWRVDLYWDHGNDNFAVEPPEGQNWAEWFEARLKGCEAIPVFCLRWEDGLGEFQTATRRQTTVEGKSAHRTTGLDVRRRSWQSAGKSQRQDCFAVVP